MGHVRQAGLNRKPDRGFRGCTASARAPILEAMSEMVCELNRPLGRVTGCPGSRCAFWVDSHCVVAGLRSDWAANRALALTLQQVRADLAPPSGRTLIPPGLRD